MAGQMKFIKYDLGNLKKGRTVVISLKGNAANVRLMDSSNFNAYKNGRKHSYCGGLAKKSPVKLIVPHSGHWYVAVDMIGLRGSVRTSVSVEPEPLPAIKQKTALSDVPTLVKDVSAVVPNETGMTYDVFISHAAEDKDAVARPLADALNNAGLTVWYDEFEMKIGDSLRRKIDHGLAHSRFGIVVISRDFIKKGWTNYELDGIITRAVSGEQMMLPIWHNITRDEVVEYSPTLADKVARNTANDSIEEIANEIANLIADKSL
ncbi:DUF1883 domain-containing protein [Collinsella stercoris]|uniref:DUF1883 domain-containing protein n=1 Tax=Collinsella stercoris TaxID=147206 RepID=UPI00248D62DF|nr:DUF1883 domain-containing protein [Collinsella stercoris]